MGVGGLVLSTREQVSLAVIEDFRGGRISRDEAARLLGVHWRTITRWANAVRAKGPQGIKHGNCGAIAPNRLADEDRQQVIALAKGRYRNFNLRHMHECLVADHGVKACYDTVRKWCNAAGIGHRRKRRANRIRLHRDRMANEGLMLQMDGSHHRWYGGREMCLMAAIDDATSHIPAARFFPTETTWACFAILRQIIETRGVPEMLYVDGAGWAGGGAKRQFFSQFVRACAELGIRVLHAKSAQAKGRIERTFRTMQDRLVAEFELHGIKSDTDANRYLEQVFLPTYWNRKLTVVPLELQSRYRPLPAHIDLNHVFCFQTKRLVGTSHTASFEGKLYRINNPELGSLKGRQVIVCQDEAGKLTWLFGSIQLNVELVKRPERHWQKRPAG